MTVTLDGRQAVISRLSGKLASGGGISATGTVGITPDSGFPANISVKFDNATYVDGTLVTATINGSVDVKNPLLTAPVLSGSLRLSRPRSPSRKIAGIAFRHQHQAQERAGGESAPNSGIEDPKGRATHLRLSASISSLMRAIADLRAAAASTPNWAAASSFAARRQIPLPPAASP